METFDVCRGLQPDTPPPPRGGGGARELEEEIEYWSVDIKFPPLSPNPGILEMFY